jgi:hypothetical protein
MPVNVSLRQDFSGKGCMQPEIFVSRVQMNIYKLLFRKNGMLDLTLQKIL